MMKHCLKKQIALALSAVLLAISLVVPTAAEGTTTPVNLVTDGGFEGQSAGALSTRIGTGNGGTNTTNNLWGKLGTGLETAAVVKDPANAYSGSHYLRGTLAALGGSFSLRPVGVLLEVEANTDYIFSFWAKSTFNVNIYGAVVPVNATGPVTAFAENTLYNKIIAKSDDWKNYTLTFNSAEKTQIALAFGSNEDGFAQSEDYYCIDDVAVYKSEDIKTVKVEATGDNTATASSALGLPGTVLTATAAGTNQFLGWYKNGVLVSKNAEYTLEAALEEDSTFLAKFSGNIIKNGGFEALAAGDLNTRYDAGGTLQNFAWGRVATSVTCGTVVANGEDAYAGNNYLSFHPTADANQFIRTVGTVVPVEQNKQYRLTFWAKSLSAENETNISAAILTTNATNIDGKIDGKPLVEILKENIDWQEYTLIFNSSSYTQVIVAFGGNADNVTTVNYAIDDVALCEVVTVSTKVNTTGVAGKVVGGTVTGAGTYNSGDEVTLTATPKAGFTFAGWSDSEANATRTVQAAAATYTANFANAGKNLIANGNLESDDFTVADVFEQIDTRKLFEKVATPSGEGYALKAAANTTVGLAVNNIALTKGHTYSFSFKYYLPKAAELTDFRNNFERYGFWKNNVSNVNGSSGYSYTHINNALDGKIVPITEEWVEASVLYTPTEDLLASVGIGTVDSSCDIDWYIDDIALYDLTACGVVATGVDSSTGKLNEAGFSAAIRAASNTDGNISKNGLRVYNAVEKDLLGDVVEYGTIVVRKGYLQKANAARWNNTALAGQTLDEPTVEMYGIGGIGFGVAYRKAGTTTATGSSAVEPILWRDDLNGVAMYTAFATGIAEAYYGDAYLYRSYAVLSNGAVVYGRTVEVSVFDVANAISNAETAPEVDTDAFNAFVNENTGTAYEKWCDDNDKETGKLYNK